MATKPARHRQLEDEPRLRRGAPPRPADRCLVEEPTGRSTPTSWSPRLSSTCAAWLRCWTPSASRSSLGAQHVNANDNGAHTGEVSVSMLRRLGVEWVIVGHSERRTLYAMDDEVVAATLRRGGARRGSTPCSASARRLEIREAGPARVVRARSTRERPRRARGTHSPLVTIAYEPLWAIGTRRERRRPSRCAR